MVEWVTVRKAEVSERNEEKSGHVIIVREDRKREGSPGPSWLSTSDHFSHTLFLRPSLTTMRNPGNSVIWAMKEISGDTNFRHLRAVE